MPDLFALSVFLKQVFITVAHLGGAGWAIQLSAIIGLVIASMKVSFLNRLLWSRMGNLKAWAGPILGILIGICSLQKQGGITLPALFAYFSVGAGSLALHELLDTIKVIPGIGPIYIGFIDIIERLLGGPASEVTK